jgi:hypothetical protein
VLEAILEIVLRPPFSSSDCLVILSNFWSLVQKASQRCTTVISNIYNLCLNLHYCPFRANENTTCCPVSFPKSSVCSKCTLLSQTAKMNCRGHLLTAPRERQEATPGSSHESSGRGSPRRGRFWPIQPKLAHRASGLLPQPLVDASRMELHHTNNPSS